MRDGDVEGAELAAGTQMPPAVRRAVLAALAALVIGAVYLFAVRGMAILVELSTVLCL